MQTLLRATRNILALLTFGFIISCICTKFQIVLDLEYFWKHSSTVDKLAKGSGCLVGILVLFFILYTGEELTRHNDAFHNEDSVK